MLQLFSFLLMFIGTLNWFFISAFQYDFVAGFFGTQSSLFSRFIYFLIGIAGFIVAFYILKNKGTLKLVEKKKKTSSQPPVATPVKVVENHELDEENEEEIEFEKPILHTQQPQTEATINFTKEGFKDFDASKYDE